MAQGEHSTLIGASLSEQGPTAAAVSVTYIVRPAQCACAKFTWTAKVSLAAGQRKLEEARLSRTGETREVSLRF